jgi:cytochrome c oxidase subunit II
MTTAIGSMRAVRGGALVIALAAAVCILGGGCMEEHPQSVVHPVGPAARAIDELWWVMFFLLSAVFMITLLLLGLALALPRRAGREEAPGGNTRFVVISGIAIPAVILAGMLIYSLQTTRALEARETDFTIRVIGHRWWWEVHYPDHGILTANEIVMPAGVPVRFELFAQDVIHSFWIPNLGGKLDMLPEKWTSYWLKADRPGMLRGQCAEYCGLQHALMAFTVEVLDPTAFAAWVAHRRGPAPEPATPELRRGRDAFFHPDAGCYTCHIVRGTSATGTLGPDLTHMGSRPTLGAGTVPLTRGALRQWIVDPHVIKPGNRMPPTVMDPEDLDALVEYLMSLR